MLELRDAVSHMRGLTYREPYPVRLSEPGLRVLVSLACSGMLVYLRSNIRANGLNTPEQAEGRRRPCFQSGRSLIAIADIA